MGRNNQRRRADKKRREGRDGRGRAAGPTDHSWRPDARAAIEYLAIVGSAASFDGDDADTDRVLDALMVHREEGAPVTAVVGELIAAGMASAWEGGWQPEEVVRQVRRRCRDAHVALAVASLASATCWQLARGAAIPAAWSSQLDELVVPADRDRAGDWLAGAVRVPGTSLRDGLLTALGLLGLVLHLPAIEALAPRPSEWHDVALFGSRTRGDDPVLAKVRALLAKAESTQFTAEAESLTAKAQELMARHAIDEAVARRSAPSGERPAVRRIPVDDPYAESKSTLLTAVGRANDVRCIWYPSFAMMAVVGFEHDLDLVELLFTSLLVQASRAMLAKGPVKDRSGRSRTRSFRQSFLVAYAQRIGERLAMAALQARQEAERDLEMSILPVLASRAEEIDDAFTQTFHHVHFSDGPSVTNGDGWHAGRIAAELATLGPEQAVLDGMATAG